MAADVIHSMLEEAEREFGKPQCWRIGSDRLFMLTSDADLERLQVNESDSALCGLPIRIDNSDPLLLELITNRGIVSER